MNKGLLAASLLLSVAACKKTAAPRKDIAAARAALERYLEAWRAGDYETMFRLTSTRRIQELTGLDPKEGTAYRAGAARRFALVADQTKRYMGYVAFEVTRVVASRPRLVVFEVRPRDAAGRRAEPLVFRLRGTRSGWKVD